VIENDCLKKGTRKKDGDSLLWVETSHWNADSVVIYITDVRVVVNLILPINFKY
jgi:hypothetical protein